MKALINEGLLSGGLCLFTGAGVSFDPPTSLPLGEELVYDYLLAHLLPASAFKHIPRHGLRPEVVMNILCKHLGEEFLASLSFFKHARPNKLHAILSRIVDDKRIVRLLTTNLDLCHEAASSSPHENKVVHLHGMADDPSSILYALDQVASARTSQAIEQLKTICEDRTVVFLGYSGRDDFDIAPALRALSPSTRFVWVQHRHGNAKFAVKQLPRSCDAWSILRARPVGSWTYIVGNTLEFCRALARQLSIEVPEAESIATDRQADAEAHKQALRSFLSPLGAKLGSMICADLLCFYLNRSKEAHSMLCGFEAPVGRTHARNYWMTRAISAQRAGYLTASQDAISETLALEPESSESLRILADAEYRLNDFDSAMRHVEEALSWAQTPRERAHALVTKALILQDTECESEAFKIYTQLIPLLRECGDLYALSDCLNNRGALYLDENYPTEAEHDYTDALRIRELINHNQGLCFCYLGLGIARRFRFCAEGGAEIALHAHEAFNSALETLPQSASTRDKFLVFKNSGDLFIDEGLYSYALEAINCSRRLAEQINGSYGDLFSCDLSLYELAILSEDEQHRLQVADRLQSLSAYPQLPDKLYWYNQLQIGYRDGFTQIDIDALPVEIYKHRVRQIRAVRP